MKLTCVKKDLEKSLSITGIFIGKNLDLPVLSCVILENKKSFLNILATNINTSCDYNIAVKSERDGKVAVSGEVLYKTISNIKNEYINLETKGNILYIKTDSVEIKINTLDYADFPSIPKIENQEEKFIKVDFLKKNLLVGLSSTYYAASKSNIKPELSSVFIDFKQDEINFVATDGFRLAEKTIKQKNKNESFKILLPLESVEQFIKLLNINDDSHIELYIYSNQLFLQSDNFVIFSRLTDGDFVEYKKLIPIENKTSIIVLKQDFIDYSKLANIFTNDFNQIKIIIKNKKINLETNNKKGKNNIKIDATVEGENIEMDFNYKYILESLPSLNTDSIEFIFNPAKPLIIKPVGDNTFKYIVMPLSK